MKIIWQTRNSDELIKKTSLTKSQKKKFKKILNSQINDLKKHYKEGAWDLDISCIVSNIYTELLDCDFYLITLNEVISKIDGLSWEKGGTWGEYCFVNKKQKIFYSPEKNQIYINTRMNDVNFDIQLDDFNEN